MNLPKSVNTTFNVLRAIVKVLLNELAYLTESQASEIDSLIDKCDVAVGAAFEVYLQNTDLEDLTHSLLSILKSSKAKPMDVDFSFRAKEQAKMQEILKKLPSGIDKDSLYVTLSRSRLIIDCYHNMVGGKANESVTSLQKFSDHLTDKMAEARAKQKSMNASLREIKSTDRRRSFKEIHDEMQVIMMEYKEDLLVQDPEVFKSVTCGEDNEVLTGLYQQIQTLNERAKIVALLNQLIEGYFTSKLSLLRTMVQKRGCYSGLPDHEEPEAAFQVDDQDT